MNDVERKCTDCNVTLRRIQLVDHQGGAAARVGLAYLLEGKPKMGVWKAEVKNQDGEVHGYLCAECLCVTLYAEPR
jgi:hypothetical protein